MKPRSGNLSTASARKGMRGFTLTELLVVTAILVVLAGIMMGNVRHRLYVDGSVRSLSLKASNLY